MRCFLAQEQLDQREGLGSAISGPYGCRGHGRVRPSTAVTSWPPLQDSEQLHGAAEDQPGAGGQVIPHGEATTLCPTPACPAPGPQLWNPGEDQGPGHHALAHGAGPKASFPPCPHPEGLGRTPHFRPEWESAIKPSAVTVPAVLMRNRGSGSQ